MEELIHREVELAELDALLRRHWTNHIVNINGYPEVGKTTLIKHWSERIGIQAFHWEATYGTVEEQRGALLRSWREAGLPGFEELESQSYRFWTQVFKEMAILAKDQHRIFFLDNFHLIIEQDPYAAGKLQAPADLEYPETKIILVLAGSDSYRMKRLLAYDAALYGRFDLHLEVKPLPFPALKHKFLEATFSDRIRIYAVIGGIPGYWRFWDQSLNLSENIQELFFYSDGILLQKAEQLFEYLARQGPYHAPVLREIARGATSLKLLQKQFNIGEYDLKLLLSELEMCRWIKQQHFAAIPRSQHRKRIRSRYEIAHPLLRFYLRFVEPNLEHIRSGAGMNLWTRNAWRLDRLIAKEDFPDLCRTWVWAEIMLNKLQIFPQGFGDYWISRRRLDVVAIDWEAKFMILGKCVWAGQKRLEAALGELKSWEEKLVPDSGWTTQLVLFLGPNIHPLSLGEEVRGLLQVPIESLDDDLFQGDLVRTERRLKAFSS